MPYRKLPNLSASIVLGASTLAGPALAQTVPSTRGTNGDQTATKSTRRAILLVLLLCAISSQVVIAAAAQKPNLILILADDCTKYDTELYGGQAKTPNLMRLAKEGMIFTQCFQAAPSCSPTRHALYTAKYPVKTGAYPNHTFVKPGITSVVQWLKAAGYRAALSGKTHINPPEAFSFEYLAEESIPADRRIAANPDFAAVDKFLGDCVRTDTPFGLFLCSNEPHTPWNKGDASAYPPERLQLPPIFADTPATRTDFSKYLAEITTFDQQVGEALALIEKHGLRDNTVVIALTEQGNAFPYAKWTCYDAGLASGLVVRWPGRVKAGSTSDALVEYVDMLPTFFEAAGLSLPDDLDGQSFLPVLLGRASHHKDYVFALQTTRGILFGSDYYGIRTVRDARYRYIVNLTPDATFKNWTTNQPWFKEWQTAAKADDDRAARLSENYQHRPAEELYDCTDDPWNQRNLISDPAQAKVIAVLRSQLAEWMEAQGDRGQETEMDALEHMWKNANQN